MKIVVTGSVAFDYIMSFPGRFTEHILPEKTDKISLSFLVDSMRKVRGGCAANIAYNLALLGERPRMLATVGQDFAPYRQWLETKGVDTSLTVTMPELFTASFFVNTDLEQNQIATFYAGAMAEANRLSFHDIQDEIDLAIISPNDPGAMQKYPRECRELGIPYIYDPSQQIVRMSPEALRDGVHGADILVVNDYEFELFKERTGMSAEEIRAAVKRAVMITRGADGSLILADERYEVPVVPATTVVDPTGVGDAYRAGLMRGLSLGLDWPTIGRVASMAASYVLETLGPQTHVYTVEEFVERYRDFFGADEFTEAAGKAQS